MNLIDIRYTFLAEDYIRELDEIEYLKLTVHASAGLSFMTAMTLAAQLKQFDAEFVLAHRTQDAVAAASARKLVRDRGRDFKIILRLTPEHTPRHLSRTLLREVDAWVVTDPEGVSSRLGSDMALIPRYTTILPSLNSEISWAENNDTGGQDSLLIMWWGEITPDSPLETIVSALKRYGERDPEAAARLTLVIHGTGKARYVMPIVKTARQIKAARIVWADKTDTIISHPEAVSDTASIHTHITLIKPDLVIDAKPLNDINIAARRDSIPTVALSGVGQAVDLLNELTHDTDDLKKVLAQQSHLEYEQKYDPMFHVEQWQKLLNSLR